MKYELTNPFAVTLKHWLAWLMLFILMFAFNVRADNHSIELCTTLDGSESIIPSDFQVQLDGLSQALRDPAVVPQDGSVTISIVHFATEARVEVTPTVITSAEVANQVAEQVTNIKQEGLGEFTGIAQAIDLCAQQFSYTAEKQVIDIVTDGEHNQDGDPIVSADNAIAKGVDAINSLGVGTQIDATKLRAMVRPQPASANLSQDGFFFQISNHSLFVDAIRAKISAETGQTVDSYPSSMVSLGGGLCLASSNDAVQIQTCNGNPNQQWVLVGNRFVNPAGQCLTSVEDGRLVVTACNGGASQTWSLQGNQLINGVGQCLDVPEAEQFTHGGRVQTSECNSNTNQTWQLSGTALLNGTGRCLDIPNWDENGKITYTWDCHAGQNQRWILNGSRLVNDYGRCLDIHAPDANTNGGQSQIWDCIDDAENQSWALNDTNELVNGTGKCLDVDLTQANANGAKVQNWDCNGQTNQEWQFLFINNYNGNLNGFVRNAVDFSGLSAVNIDVKANTVLTSNNITTGDGSYNVGNVPTKQSVVAEFTREGYIPATYNDINIQFGDSLALDQVLLIPEQYAGTGTMTGLAINGITGGGLADVTLRLREGMNTQTGDIVVETVSTDDGSYQLQTNGGNYTLEASKLGFVTSYTNVVVLGGETRPEQNVTLVPILGSGEVRAVLTWGRTPLDLDAHVTGPLANDERFHVFWPTISRGSLDTTPFAQLDVDDVLSYGPETITLAQTNLAGVYRYSVHDYTNRAASGNNGLAKSGAQVNIYNEFGLIATLNVPNQSGTLWTVFEIREGQLRLINSMTNESNSRSIKRGADTVSTDYDVISQQPNK
ncbi:ricin-type beta-trefoil lectin domain protein [Candidatus Albibeggiatoa sp. nov. NOAA]|uniref:ricin-type beta-trefoil lectin domain protein n=1 Tax=Candidatus Albibeggiatoa sp. nov. NOAA TaxID=3162724 RepID=UPI0032FC1328|nr:ricin-type beta-trefoil lectin domain protein [Thiotrichaceae bacterium]